MSASSSAPVQALLPRRASVETLAGLRCSLVAETDSAFACPICSRVLRLPQLTDCCGNHFCTSCLSRWLQMSSSCPLCRQVGFKSIRDKKIERAVQDMEVYCHHEDSGCTWKGRLCDVDSHLASACPHVLVECPHSCGDTVPREAVQSHVADACIHRPVSCIFCSLEGPLDFITAEHHNVCPKVYVCCPNGCPVANLPREEIAGHLHECPQQLVECGFRGFGCEETVARKELESHMNSRQTHHLLLAMEKVSEMGRQIESWRGDTDQLRGDLLRSQREVEGLRNLVQALYSQQSVAMGGGGGGELLASADASRQTRRLLMEKHLEASSQICQRDPFLPVVLKMNDFSYYSTNREPWYSHPFYSEPLGYKFCLCVYANGVCSGQFTHVSTFVHLMAGEFDESQEWPLELRLTIELQNQLADKDHWETDCEFRSSGSRLISQRVSRGRARRGAGTATFVPLDKLGHNAAYPNCQFLRNNQLFIAVY